MIDNRLTVNAKKSNYVILSRAQRKLEKETCVIHLNGSRLAKVRETKYLQTIRSVGGGLSMEWATGGATRCFTKLQRFQETTQKGLNEPAIGSWALLVVSSEAARTTKYYESGVHVWTELFV